MDPIEDTVIEGCPSPQVLQNWAQGTLPENQVDEVTEHIGKCRTCDLAVSHAQSLHSLGPMKLATPFLQESQCDDLSHPLNLEEAAQPDAAHSRYELKGEIARGGMGMVLKGHDKNLGRDLAIKILLDKYNDDPEVVQRFVEEAQIGGQLQHPGIAPVYELGKFADKRRFFAMKLVKGQTLSQLLKERDNVTSDVSRFVGIFEQMCQTMAYAHSRRVIHRDLKPANIMVGAFGEVQVMDWGLAKVMPTPSESDEETPQEEQTAVGTRRAKADTEGQDSVAGLETQIGRVIGTLAYMPPEQALGETDQLDERADVFGLGAILCKILTGKPPYVASKSSQVYVMASQGSLLDCLKRLDACAADTELVQLTKDCLQADRNDRPRTAGIVADRVTKYLESVASKLQEAKIERAAESARADSESARRRTSLALAASVLLLFGVAGAGWMYMERQAANRLTAAAEADRLHAEAMDKERANAVTAKESAEAAEEEGRQLVYATDMQLTPLLWENPDVTLTQLRRRLDAHDPKANPDIKGKEDLRGFEWYYYDNLLKNSAAVFTGHTDPVLDARVDGGGELVTLTRRGQIRRWDLSSRLEDSTLRIELSGGKWMGKGGLSHDGQRAAVFVSNMKVVRVCDTSTGQLIWQIKNSGRCDHLCFSENGKWLVVVDRNVQWLDAKTGRVVGVYHRDPEPRGRAALSHDGRTLAVTSDSGKTRAYQLDEKQKKVEMSGWTIDKSDNGTLCLAVTPDGTGVVESMSGYPWVGAYKHATSDQVDSDTRAHTTPVSAITFLGSGPQIATAEVAGTIRIWSSIDELMSGGEPTKTFKGHSDAVRRLTLSPDGRHLVSNSFSEGVRVWDMEGENAGIHRLPGSFTNTGVQFSPDGRSLVTLNDNRIQIWEATTNRRLGDWRVTEKGEVSAIAWSPGNQNILAIGYMNTGDIQPDGVPHISLWDISAGQELCQLPGSKDLPNVSRHDQDLAIGALAFSPDGKYLAVGFGSPFHGHTDSADSSLELFPLKVWDVETRQLRNVLYGHTNFCRELEFTADGATLASCSSDGTVILWSTDTWKAKHTLKNVDFRKGKGNEDVLSPVESLSLSPDGETLAMGSQRANLHLWELNSGAHLATLPGHSGAVKSVVFSPDGRTLASGSGDGSLRLWHVATRQELFKLNDDRLANVLSFSPDGKKLVGVGLDLAFWSSVPVVGHQPGEFSNRLREFLDSGDDFADSIRLHSSNLRLHESLASLSSEDPRVATALAATRANWLASEERWEDAEAEFDRLLALDRDTAHAWLNDNGLLRLATALLDRGRLADCNQLLATVKRRVDVDSSVDYRIDVGLERIDESMVVTTVEADSAAARAGLREGDTILKVNGQDTTPGTIQKQLSSDQATSKELLIKRGESEEQEIIRVVGKRQLKEELGQQLNRLQSTVEQYLAKNPGDAAAHEFRGGLFGFHGDFESQILEYTAAIEALADGADDTVDADLARLYRSRGDASLREEQWQTAVDDYARIVTADTDDEVLLANQAAAKAGNLLTEAVASSTSYDVAQIDDPWKRLAVAHYLTYNQNELQSLLTRRPQVGESIGDLLSADGQWQSARVYYDQALQAKPVLTAVFEKRAEVLEQLGQWDDAATDWAKASQQKSDVAFTRFKPDETPGWDTTQSESRVKSLEFAVADGVVTFGAKPESDSESEPKSLRVSQSKLRIENDATYRLSFQMKSPDQCKMRVQGRQLDRKEVSIGLQENMELSPEFQPYQFTFVAQNVDAGNSFIRFVIPPKTPGMVSMKDIVFMKISESNVRQIDPTGIEDTKLKRAVTLHQSGQLESLGDLVTKSPEVNVGIGDLYADLQRWTAAIAFYSKAIAPDSENVPLLVKRALANEELKQWDQAAADWALASRQQTDIAFQRFKSADEEPWKLWGEKESTPSMNITDGVVEFGKALGTKNPSDVRLSQRRLQLENGATYMLRFKMKSPDGCSVSLKAQYSSQTDSSWLLEAFKTTSMFKDYEFTFVPQNAKSGESSITFDSGQEPGMVTLKDVVLMKIADPPK